MYIEKTNLPSFLNSKFSAPDFYQIEMNYPDSHLPDVEEETRNEILREAQKIPIQNGETVAIGIGSRGIVNLPEIVRTTCLTLKSLGAKPFIVPAMGSHGNATAEGQLDVLQSLGISETSIGCPIRSSMDVVQLGSFSDIPIFFSKDAMEADHSICINRIKPHTKFKGTIESGIIKMMAVGFGKHTGALNYHRWALRFGFSKMLEETGKIILKNSNFKFGLGIIEDASDKIFKIEGISSNELFETEANLLKISKAHLPGLPVKDIDVLIVQQIGKEISGAGMDPNVTGRAGDLMEDDFSHIFKTKRLVVLNLSKGTAGNALGVGTADVITRKVVDSMDYEKTMTNALTGISLQKISIPLVMPTDEKAIQTCFSTIGPIPPENVRALIIKDTLHLTTFWASQALLAQLQTNPLVQVKEPVKLIFDNEGNLIPGRQ